MCFINIFWEILLKTLEPFCFDKIILSLCFEVIKGWLKLIFWGSASDICSTTVAAIWKLCSYLSCFVSFLACHSFQLQQRPKLPHCKSQCQLNTFILGGSTHFVIWISIYWTLFSSTLLYFLRCDLKMKKWLLCCSDFTVILTSVSSSQHL